MVYICRHGQTQWNVEGRLQGSKDSDLTELGIQQGILMGKRLHASEQVHRIISTPLGRGLNTAKLIAWENNIPEADIIVDSRLREKSFGRHEGMTRDERQKLYLNELHAYGDDRRNFAFQGGGESDALIEEGLRDFVENEAPQDTDVIVTHSGTGRMLLGILGDLSEGDKSLLNMKQNVIHNCRDGKLSYDFTGIDTTRAWIEGYHSI